MIIVRFVMGALALGLGIWYISSSISGASLSYTSLNGFMTAIGAHGDISGGVGCFLCGYVEKLFAAIGSGAEMFWVAIVDYIWVLLAIGFGIWLFIYTARYIYDAILIDKTDQKLELGPWFAKVWPLGVRIMVVGVLLGMLGLGGTGALRVVTNLTVTPVMVAGAELSMAATGVATAAQCPMSDVNDDVLTPVLRPFMCVMGNLNTVMLAGAAAGFSMMNYAWLGIGGGVITWIAGLGLVILFLIIGFNLFFQILSIVFKLVFLIVFLPLLLAAAAFEGTWKMADDVVKNAINMLVKSAVQIVAITLKIIIIYATISYAADMSMPGPRDGYSAIMPPLMNAGVATNPDAQTMAVQNVFAACEQVGLRNGTMDADAFRTCFTARRAAVERKYPGAFDFMGDGWNFILMMIGLFLLYYYVVEPKVDGILGKVGSESFDFGGWLKELGKKVWGLPTELISRISKAAGTKD